MISERSALTRCRVGSGPSRWWPGCPGRKSAALFGALGDGGDHCVEFGFGGPLEVTAGCLELLDEFVVDTAGVAVEQLVETPRPPIGWLVVAG
ncbi:MAG: hypothetical protein M5U19_01910 [Microthrixaceae bacterium]|nr:hypothetical protein [Microthrixaceae bacterium]